MQYFKICVQSSRIRKYFKRKESWVIELLHELNVEILRIYNNNLRDDAAGRRYKPKGVISGIMSNASIRPLTR